MRSRRKGIITSAACLAWGIFPAIGYSQDPQSPSAAADRAAQAPESSAPQASKRIFWIIPNYRTYPTLVNYKPLTRREKFKIALQDSFDRGTVAQALAFAGERQLAHASPSFGQGVEGYAHYFGTAYADFVIGDYMTEAIFPSLLHQDPRYFRRGTGSFKSRLGYAMGQTFWTHTDSGGKQFNYSELAGNATAAAISNAYYPDNRTAANWATQFGTQIGLDMAGNVLKEFWPDIYGKLARKHQP